uniref:EF-hand domain-containing protein n=1 Tax=Panagrolaimus superbus TaxID=310955 RepID=A0A914ZF96_9BILA
MVPNWGEKPPLSIPMEQMTCQSAEECDSWLAFDGDNDGLIAAGDLLDGVRHYPNLFQISDDEAVRMIHEVDGNEDQLIDFREFCDLMCRAKNDRLKRLALIMGNATAPRNRQTDVSNYLLEYSCWPPPLFIIFVTVFEIIFYIYDTTSHGYSFQPHNPAPTWSPLILNPHHREWIWTYISYVFVHVGYIHLLSNLTLQIVLGISLELVHKGIRIGGLYCCGAITGALLFWVFDRHVYLAGASGGVYALITAHLADVIMNWSEMPFRWIRVFAFSAFIIADFGYAAYERFFANVVVKIAVTAHIGGAIAGLFLGIVLLRNLRHHKWELFIWYSSLVAYVFFNLVLIVLIIAPSLW